MRIESNHKALEEALKNATEHGLRSAAVFLVGQLQQVLSVVNPGKSVKYKRPSKSGAKSRTVYGQPSKPGEAPRQRTGWGKGHVGFEEGSTGDGYVVRVGVPESAEYLAYHEAGINYGHAGARRYIEAMKRKQASGKLKAKDHEYEAKEGVAVQRPWLVVTVERLAPVLAQLFVSGARQ